MPCLDTLHLSQELCVCFWLSGSALMFLICLGMIVPIYIRLCLSSNTYSSGRPGNTKRQWYIISPAEWVFSLSVPTLRSCPVRREGFCVGRYQRGPSGQVCTGKSSPHGWAVERPGGVVFPQSIIGLARAPHFNLPRRHANMTSLDTDIQLALGIPPQSTNQRTGHTCGDQSARSAHEQGRVLLDVIDRRSVADNFPTSGSHASMPYLYSNRYLINLKSCDRNIPPLAHSRRSATANTHGNNAFRPSLHHCARRTQSKYNVVIGKSLKIL
jgi:hypothetical protein